MTKDYLYIIMLLASILCSSNSAYGMASVRLSTSVVGITGNATISLTVTQALPANSTVQVVFPRNFEVSGVDPSVHCTLDSLPYTGFSSTLSYNDTVKVILIDGPEIPRGVNITCTMFRIMNPVVAGGTGTFQIMTINNTDLTVLQSHLDVAEVTILAPAFSTMAISSSNRQAGKNSTVRVELISTGHMSANDNITISGLPHWSLNEYVSLVTGPPRIASRGMWNSSTGTLGLSVASACSAGSRITISFVIMNGHFAHKRIIPTIEASIEATENIAPAFMRATGLSVIPTFSIIKIWGSTEVESEENTITLMFAATGAFAYRDSVKIYNLTDFQNTGTTIELLGNNSFGNTASWARSTGTLQLNVSVGFDANVSQKITFVLKNPPFPRDSLTLSAEASLAEMDGIAEVAIASISNMATVTPSFSVATISASTEQAGDENLLSVVFSANGAMASGDQIVLGNLTSFQTSTGDLVIGGAHAMTFGNISYWSQESMTLSLIVETNRGFASGTKISITFLLRNQVVPRASAKPFINASITGTSGIKSVSMLTLNMSIVDRRPPVFLSASISNFAKENITVVFDEVISSGVPNASDFIVRVNHSRAISVVHAYLDGGNNKILLTLSAALTSAHAISIEYVGKTSMLQDAFGNVMEPFGKQHVRNDIKPPIVYSVHVFMAPPIGLSTSGGSLLIWNISGNYEFFDSSDLNIGLNISVYYGPAGDRTLYETQSCVHKSAIEISCITPAVQPFKNRSNLQAFLVTKTGNNTRFFFANESLFYQRPFVKQVSPTVLGSSTILATAGGDQVILSGYGFGPGATVYYGIPDVYLYQAKNITVYNMTHISCVTVPAFRGVNRTRFSWYIVVMDQTSYMYSHDAIFSSFREPTISSVSTMNNAMNTSGGDSIILTGFSFGPVQNAHVTLQYGVFGEGNNTFSNFFTGLECSVTVFDVEIRCTSAPGEGSGLRLRVQIHEQSSAYTGSILTYKPPSLYSVLSDDASGLPTNGENSTISLIGDNFGPTLLVYMHLRSGRRIYAHGCVLIDHSQVECSSVDAGAGKIHSTTIVVMGQTAELQHDSFGYRAPKILSISSEYLDVVTEQDLLLSGNNFGRTGGFLRLEYGVESGEKFEARDCKVVVEHTKIMCTTLPGLHNSRNKTNDSFSWKLQVDGIWSSAYYATSIYKHNPYVGVLYKDELQIGLRTFDSLTDTLYIVGQGMKGTTRTSSLRVYTKGRFGTRQTISSSFPSGISTLNFFNGKLYGTRSTGTKIKIGYFEEHGGGAWDLVTIGDIRCPDKSPASSQPCRLKYGVSALNEKSGIIYLAVRRARYGDVLIMYNLYNGNQMTVHASASLSLEFSQLAVRFTFSERESQLEAIWRDHSPNGSTSPWKHGIVDFGNTTVLNETKGYMMNRTSRREQLLDKLPYQPTYLYRAMLNNEYQVNSTFDGVVSINDIGVQEYSYAVPVQSGPSFFNFDRNGYSMIASGYMLDVKEPKISFSFPDSKTGWDQFRIVAKSDKICRVYFLVVQRVKGQSEQFPDVSQMFEGTFVRPPDIAGALVAHRQYVLNIENPMRSETLLVGGDIILPDTADYDIFYLARAGSFTMSIVRRVFASTVSQPPTTKIGFPEVSDVTVSSFVFNMRFSDRRGKVYYVVTEDSMPCDEVALAAPKIPDEDLVDRLQACANSQPIYMNGTFEIGKRETLIDGDINRGEFSGFVSILDLPPYKSFYVYSVGISFGLTAQFSYAKTLVNLVGFTTSSDQNVVNEGNSTEIPIYVKLSKQPQKDEEVHFTCTLDDPTNNIIYTQLPPSFMEGRNYINWGERMLVGHVKSRRDTINHENSLQMYAIICSNIATTGIGMIYNFQLNIRYHMFSRNVIWPEWSTASVKYKDYPMFLLPEAKNAITATEFSVYKLEQLDKTWIGKMFLPGLRATIANIDANVVVGSDGRTAMLTLPSFTDVCPRGACTGESGYKTLNLFNPEPRLANMSDAGWAVTEYVYYFEKCTDTSFETAPSVCLKSHIDSAACAWGIGESCRPCIQHTICPGGPRAWPSQGFWSTSEFSEDIFRCRTPSNERCHGYNITSHRSECKYGYDPNTPFCDRCDIGFYESIDGRCNSCEGKNDFISTIFFPLARGVGLLLLILLFVCNLVYLSTVMRGGTVYSSIEMTLRFVFESALAIQLITIAGMPINSKYLDFLKRLFNGLYLTLFDFRGQVYAHCLSSSAYVPFVFEIGGMVIVLVAYILFALLANPQAFNKLKNTLYLQKILANSAMGHTRNGLLSFLQLSYGAVAVNSFDLINCKLILGEYRLARRPSFVCYEGAHLGAALISLILIFVFVLGFPIVTYAQVRYRLAKEKDHRAPHLEMFSFWTRSDLKKKYYWFREIRQIVVAFLAMTSALFTDNVSRSGAFGINIFLLSSYSGVLLYNKPYEKRGGWIMSTLISACVVGAIATMLSFLTLLKYDYGEINSVELIDAAQWTMLFAVVGFLALAWWRFEAHILAFRKSMSVDIMVKSKPEHRWENHVRRKIVRLTPMLSTTSLKGKKTSKILPAPPKLKPGHTPNPPRTERHKPRSVTKVVPTQFGNIVRLNMLENDGHQLSVSWCFSTDTLHQSSIYKKNINWWYSLQFCTEVLFIVILSHMPMPPIPASVRNAVSSEADAVGKVAGARLLFSNSTVASDTLDYVQLAKVFLQEAVQALLITKGILTATGLFLSVTVRRKSLCRFRGSWAVFQFIFVCFTIMSIYGLVWLNHSFEFRMAGIVIQSITLCCSLLAFMQHRTLQKRAARVQPSASLLPDNDTASQAKKNKIRIKGKKKKSIMKFLAGGEEQRSTTKVVPQSNIHGHQIFEEHFYDESKQFEDVGVGPTSVGCILLLKPAVRMAKEIEMMRHEEERQNMVFEDSWALRCRDEPKRLRELTTMQREEERQQMYEWEKTQRAIQDEKSRRMDLIVMRLEEDREHMFLNDTRSRAENFLFEEWKVLEQAKELVELEDMRRVEENQRIRAEELREYWLAICATHIDDLVRDFEIQSLEEMRRVEEQQRMFEIEFVQRRDANFLVAQVELPRMRREEAQQRMFEEEQRTHQFAKDHQAAASQMSAIRVLKEKKATGDVDIIQVELEKVRRVFNVVGPLARLVEECDEYVRTKLEGIKLDLIDSMNDFDNPNHLDRLEISLSKAWHALHPKEEKLLAKAQKIEKELEHLRDIANQVEKLDQTTIAEIKSFKKPNEQVVAVIVGMFITLGHSPEELDTWAKCTALLGKTGEMGVKRRILNHRLSLLNSSRVKLIKRLTKTVDISKIKGISSGASVLHGWVLGVLSEWRIRGPNSRSASRASLGASKSPKKKAKGKKIKAAVQSLLVEKTILENVTVDSRTPDKANLKVDDGSDGAAEARPATAASSLSSSRGGNRKRSKSTGKKTKKKTSRKKKKGK